MRKLGYIALFGFLGGLCRVSLTVIFAQQHAIITILINVFGSLLLALVSGILPEMMPLSGDVLVGLSVGFVGTFTTFSTFCVDTVTLQQPNGLVYWALSVVFGYGAAWLGSYWTEKSIARRDARW